MCGISGFISVNADIANKKKAKIMEKLLRLSETRGKDSTGIACLHNDDVAVLKGISPARLFVKSEEYKKYEKRVFYKTDKMICIGHNRLATNGSPKSMRNCQPVSDDGFAVSHNGIIVNDFAVWDRNGGWKRDSELDSEIMLRYLTEGEKKGDSIKDSLEKGFNDIYGASSLCGIHAGSKSMFACTNVGSIYYWLANDQKTAVIASEKHIVERTLCSELWEDYSKQNEIRQLKPYELILCTAESDCVSLRTYELKPRDGIPDKGRRRHADIKNWDMLHEFEADVKRIKALRRCKKCLLPETMPFIKFDEDGECNYCKKWVRPYHFGDDKLREWAEDYKKKNGKVLAMLSGGRDSSYGLHYLKRELDLKVVAYGYDWGMITDLARRNQSRMCDKLGIEYIVVSADIEAKRRNIKKNISAWLKRPSLGMVPLFMAGDKQYFHYGNDVAKKNHIAAICLSSNRYEITNFKYGFCGVTPPTFRDGWGKGTEQLPWTDVIKMAGYYAKEYIRNPGYMNQSLLDTAWAAFSNYGIKHDYLRIYDYVGWNERKINDVLIREYDWETSPYTSSTWRIGDGTAPFYNYIYYILCGFTESDCLRSNQIRGGMISREEGERLAEEENRIDFDGMNWYFDAVGMNMHDVLKTIHGFKRLY